MNKLLAAIGIAVVSFGPSAVAADMVVKARPIDAIAPASWSGFYVGGQAGYTWGYADYIHTSTSGFVEGFAFQPRSLIGGTHAGMQRQWGNWVFGIEGSFNWTRLDETRTSVPKAPVFKTFELNDLATIVGKAGYAANNWLIYVKGGWAGAYIGTQGISPVTGVTADPQKWENGLTAGGGVDYLVATNWILGVDVNYYHFNFDRSAIASNGLTTTWSNASANVYAVMGRISYKFGL
jgi:outer membrane immunogenic protein